MIDYRKRMQAIEDQLEDLDRRIEELRAMVHTSQAPPGREFADALNQAVRQRDGLRAQLVTLKVDDAESWTRHDVIDGVFGALDDLGKSLDRLTHTGPRH